MQSVEDFLKNGGSITTVPAGKKASKKPLSRDQVAAKNGLTYDAANGVYLDEHGNWIAIKNNNQPDWEGLE